MCLRRAAVRLRETAGLVADDAPGLGVIRSLRARTQGLHRHAMTKHRGRCMALREIRPTSSAGSISMSTSAGPQTLYDKIWDKHVVRHNDDGTHLIYIDPQIVARPFWDHLNTIC